MNFSLRRGDSRLEAFCASEHVSRLIVLPSISNGGSERLPYVHPRGPHPLIVLNRGLCR